MRSFDTPFTAALAAALALINIAAWAAFRIDKARARRRALRIPERHLLTLAALGGSLGACVGMYGHRRRHKVDKRGFVAVVWICAAVHACALGAVLLVDCGPARG